MVLVLLKNILFPSSETERRFYRCDVENRMSKHPSYATLDGSDTSSETFFTEEHLSYNEALSCKTTDAKNKRRIDPRMISDAILGLSDGLTVPFALCAGLSALGDTKIVISGGMAELFAGAISMGLGGWLAARTEAESYHALLSTTRQLVMNCPHKTASMIRDTIETFIPVSETKSLPRKAYLNSDSTTDAFVTQSLRPNMQLNEMLESQILQTSPEQITSFLMAFYHRSSPPADSRSALTSAATIALGYFLGGFVPLMPYFFIGNINKAFWASIVVVCMALFIFGASRYYYVNIDSSTDACTECDLDKHSRNSKVPRERRAKTFINRQSMLFASHCAGAGVQMLLLGVIAACAAMGFVKIFNAD